MTLIELTYVSFAIKRMSIEDLQTLLQISKTNNAKINVTGMLLYRDRYFIQTLEGEKSIVEDLFAKISKDRRHTNILLAAKETISQRAFDNWSMGFANLDLASKDEKNHIESLDGFSDFFQKSVADDFFSAQPTRAQTLLGSFRSRSWR